jgi:hypothetical protein
MVRVRIQILYHNKQLFGYNRHRNNETPLYTISHAPLHECVAVMIVVNVLTSEKAFKCQTLTKLLLQDP